MNVWQWFTWANVAILGLGSPIVLVFFFMTLKSLLGELNGNSAPATDGPTDGAPG